MHTACDSCCYCICALCAMAARRIVLCHTLSWQRDTQAERMMRGLRGSEEPMALARVDELLSACSRDANRLYRKMQQASASGQFSIAASTQKTLTAVTPQSFICSINPSALAVVASDRCSRGSQQNADCTPVLLIALGHHRERVCCWLTAVSCIWQVYGLHPFSLITAVYAATVYA